MTRPSGISALTFTATENLLVILEEPKDLSEITLYPRDSPEDQSPLAFDDAIKNDIVILKPSSHQYDNFFNDLLVILYEMGGRDKGVAKLLIPQDMYAILPRYAGLQRRVC